MPLGLQIEHTPDPNHDLIVTNIRVQRRELGKAARRTGKAGAEMAITDALWHNWTGRGRSRKSRSLAVPLCGTARDDKNKGLIGTTESRALIRGCAKAIFSAAYEVVP